VCAFLNVTTVYTSPNLTYLNFEMYSSWTVGEGDCSSNKILVSFFAKRSADKSIIIKTS
jgi:hypothetical protein